MTADRDIASFEVQIPAKDPQTGNIIGMTDVVGNRNSYTIRTKYGMESGDIAIRVYDFDEDTLGSLSPGDPIWIRSYGEIPIKARVLRPVFSPQREEGGSAYFKIEALSESAWAMRNRIIFSKRFDKPVEIFALIEEMLAAAFSINTDIAPKIVYLKSESGTYKYSSTINDGSRAVGDIIDDLVDQNDMEWYCDPFDGSITIGKKAPARPYNIDDMLQVLINKVKYFWYGGRQFMAFILEGSPSFLVGTSLVVKGVTWKIIKAMYGESGDGTKESIGVCIKNNNTATRQLMDAIGMLKSTPVDTSRVFVADVSIPSDDEADAWKQNTKILFNRDTRTITIDPQEFEFYDGQVQENVIWSSPYAGDGIGMRFPVKDKQRNLIMAYNQLQNYSILGSAIWKKDDVVPECNPKDFYFRMEKGSLYFDEDANTWLIKSQTLKMEADDPDSADTKPDPSTATGMWLELDKDSHVTIHVDDSNYIEVASDGNTVAEASTKIRMVVGSTSVEIDSSGNVKINASSLVEAEAPSIKLGSSATLNNARVTDTVSTATLSPWWIAAVAAATGGGGPALTGWAAFYAYMAANAMPSNVGAINSNASKVKSQ